MQAEHDKQRLLMLLSFYLAGQPPKIAPSAVIMASVVVIGFDI